MVKPSGLFRLLKDPWGIYQDYHGPAPERVDETTAYERLRMEAGSRFEADWIRQRFPDAVMIEGYKEENLRQTIDAMRRGVRAIRHPQLWWLKKEVYGQGDLLVRCDDAPSDLGSWHYRVKEGKKSKSVQDYHRLQGGLYNLILGHIQGYTPPTFDIFLPSGEVPVLMEEVEQDLKDTLDLWGVLRDGLHRPELPGYDEALSPWRIYANKLLVQQHDVTLIAGFTARTRRKLRDALAVKNQADLAKLTLQDFEHVFEDESAIRHFWQARAYLERRPILLPGAQLSISRRRRTIYWDFETSDSVHPTEPPHAYMIGTLEDGKYRAFVAEGAADEERMFREFIALVGKPSDVHLCHWTGFEEKVLEHAAERHPTIAKEIRALLSCCVDLYRLVKEAVVLPVSSYSVKDVAPVFGFNWRQADVDGFASMVAYWRYLETDEFEELVPILTYNEDDCRALKAVVDGLRREGLLTG
jgi:uncharacterized protein